MTSTEANWDIFGKTRHGGRYAVAEGLPIGTALRLVNLLNKDHKDDYFHHFYASRTDVANRIIAFLPGERIPGTARFVAWLVEMGIVEQKPGGRYKIGSETLRGKTAVASKFGSVDFEENWTVTGLTYKRPQ
jgi:hypothetical protein